jgi:hypothetical protein
MIQMIKEKARDYQPNILNNKRNYIYDILKVEASQ